MRRRAGRLLHGGSRAGPLLTTCALSLWSTLWRWPTGGDSRPGARPWCTPTGDRSTRRGPSGTASAPPACFGSMGRVASAVDNSMMESFFGTLQLELLDRRSWTTRAELALPRSSNGSRAGIPAPPSHLDRRSQPRWSTKRRARRRRGSGMMSTRELSEETGSGSFAPERSDHKLRDGVRLRCPHRSEEGSPGLGRRSASYHACSRTT